jgi:putative MATE family efflux protein
MPKQKNRDLTQGNIAKQLAALTWPMIFGMLGTVIFNLVDTYFVGKLGVNQLAAISFCFPVIMFINSLSLGIGIGTSSLVSRNVIVSDRHDIRLIASRAIILGISVVVLFVSIGLLTIRPLFTALGADTAIIGYIQEYMQIWYFGVPFVLMPMIGNNIVRALGDTFTPGMIMMASALVNSILDPLLIFGIGPFPEMGIRGAALATVISRSISFIIILIILCGREKLLTRKIGGLRPLLSTWWKVLYVAGPAALSLLITPVSVGLITRIISDFGKEAVAGFGVASRIEMFALMVVNAMGSVLLIFIGQNFSKCKFPRIYRVIEYAGGFSVLWGAAVYLIVLFFARNIASVFSNDAAVVDVTVKYLLIVGFSYGFQGLVRLSTQSFNGMNKPHPAAFFPVLRTVGLYVPLAWAGARLFGLTGVFWSAFIANVVAGLLGYAWLIRTVKKEECRGA